MPPPLLLFLTRPAAEDSDQRPPSSNATTPPSPESLTELTYSLSYKPKTPKSPPPPEAIGSCTIGPSPSPSHDPHGLLLHPSFSRSKIKGNGTDTDRGVVLSGFKTRRCNYDAVIQDEKEVCCICLDDLYHGSMTALDCGHEFHPGCIRQWLFRGKNFCPLCKAPAMKRPRVTLASLLDIV
ncbi:RING finger protein 44-like [Salvia hispanica]|uniref:RING finger protein 44-like n=1 Tax=Salvia hispanica TaxID=49212 RepID=UPI00200950DC|nr:RING finger protein 44-like [Salvia hispanica]